MTTTMNTGAASLLPCPMCGAAPKLIVGYSPLNHAFVDCDCGMQTALKDTGEEVTAMWNRRSPTPQADAAIAAGGAQEAYAYEIESPDRTQELVYPAYLERYATDEERDLPRRPLYAAPLPRVAATVSLTDGWIVSIWEGMPDGASGFRKSWGYLQFARALLAASNGEQA